MRIYIKDIEEEINKKNIKRFCNNNGQFILRDYFSICVNNEEVFFRNPQGFSPVNKKYIEIDTDIKVKDYKLLYKYLKTILLRILMDGFCKRDMKFKLYQENEVLFTSKIFFIEFEFSVEDLTIIVQ